jgi:multicomponent K+:H+ antiporter subunit E
MRRVLTGLRRFPPVLIGVLLVMWLLLNQTLAVGQILLGLVLALAVAYASSVLRPVQPSIKRGYLALVLLAHVLRDIVRSNFGVARIVLGLVRDREVRAGFVKVPLELRDPHGLAVLAGIFTSTPGTVWVDHDLETNVLTLHVLDVRDEAEWIAWVKDPYERLLREIFE